VFLGLDEAHRPWVAQAVAASDAMKDLRSLMLEGGVPARLLGLLAQARALLYWHASHGFCARCGAPSTMTDAGYRRHCAACGTDHFPRTDPVVIMAVRKPGHVLLGRQASWPIGMYSTLAGFMEPGETIEDAARREVFEEAGIRVGAVRYAASQPWPFPASLMIGLIGEAASDAITIDSKEIEEARWFAHDELRLMLDGRHPGGLWASRPQAIAYHLVRLALQSP
jgi:NAD+ diphosphatase